MAVRGADAPVGHPLDEVLERDVDVARLVDPPSGLGERRVERLGLDLGPREAVEDRAPDGVLRPETVEEDADDGFVRDQLAAAHVAVGLATERRAGGDRGAQQVARCQDRDAEPLRQRRRLRALPGARRPEQDDDGHETAANLTADPCVVASGRSLTHLGVRSLPSSAPPSARLASFADSRFAAAII